MPEKKEEEEEEEDNSVQYTRSDQLTDCKTNGRVIFVVA